MSIARSLRFVRAASAAVILLGCGDDGLSPEAVAGAYFATSFTTTTGGQTTDELAAGADIFILLNPDGSTTGELFIPEGNENGSDLIASMNGTWSLSGNTVTFEQAADTFMRDMEFTVEDGTLVGDETFGATRVRVTLSRAFEG